MRVGNRGGARDLVYLGRHVVGRGAGLAEAGREGRPVRQEKHTSVERRLKDEEPEPEPEGRSEASPPGLSAKPSPPPLRPITGDGRGALGELMTSRTASYHHNPHGCKSELKGALGGANRTAHNFAWSCTKTAWNKITVRGINSDSARGRQGRRDLQNSVIYDLHACVAGRKHARRFACGSE